MNTIEKTQMLKELYPKILEFEFKLCNENVEEFEKIKNKIFELLDENQKIRFSQIKFYTKDNSSDTNEDLPF